MNNDSIGSRLNHCVWPDGSVSRGTPLYNYAQACAQYERLRRASSITTRVTLFAFCDGTFGVGSDQWGRSQTIRSTAGNVYPHPMATEERPTRPHLVRTL